MARDWQGWGLVAERLFEPLRGVPKMFLNDVSPPSKAERPPGLSRSWRNSWMLQCINPGVEVIRSTLG